MTAYAYPTYYFLSLYYGFLILSVTDLVMLVCQLLRRDLRELKELVDIMEPVKSWDEG